MTRMEKFLKKKKKKKNLAWKKLRCTNVQYVTLKLRSHIASTTAQRVRFNLILE